MRIQLDLLLSFLYFSIEPDSCFWEFHPSSVTLGVFVFSILWKPYVLIQFLVYVVFPVNSNTSSLFFSVYIFYLSPSSSLYPFPHFVALGMIVADFMSGLVHWAADSYGSVTMPVFGQVNNLFNMYSCMYVKNISISVYVMMGIISV